MLGNFTIGNNVYLGANAVVLRDVPDDSTVVGVPGRIVRHLENRVASTLEHTSISDPVMQKFDALQRDMTRIEQEVRAMKSKPPGKADRSRSKPDEDRKSAGFLPRNIRKMGTHIFYHPSVALRRRPPPRSMG